MSSLRDGHRFLIPASRRLTWDLLWFNRDVPLCGHDRRMSLGVVREVRDACPVRIGWPVLFLKAMALVARDIPQFRQTWYRWPLAHLYQHPESIASITVHRELNGEPWLFWGILHSPETRSLESLQKQIDAYRTEDVAKVFRRQWHLAKLPTLFRRALWWWNLNVAAKKRATRLGTFFVSTLAGRGTEIQVPPSVHTCCLTYGPLDEQQTARVTMAYDHRVMDGSLIAHALEKLEATLNGTIADELRLVNATDRSRTAA
ncbi:MAG: hypothetical protein ACK58L_01075 [Planctomycetota bacterium]